LLNNAGIFYAHRERRVSVLKAFEDMRTKIKLSFAMEILILAAWGIWIVRNNKVFKDQNANFNSWKEIYNQELRMLVHMMKKKHARCNKKETSRQGRD
jgi:hypothetical protein